MSICQIDQMSKIYRSPAGDVSALKQVSCAIDEGEFVVVAGPSGAGKTTLVNIIGLIDTLSDGQYKFNGVDVSTRNAKERTLLRRDNVGFIFQSFNLMEILTAQENVALASELAGEKPSVAKKKALEMLDMVGIADLAKRLPNQLSGGQQQRVSIARALVKSPLLLIADEPTASLDAKNTEDTISIMLDLNKSIKSVCVVCTHDERVIKVAPRLIYLDDGKIIEDSTSGASTNTK